MLPGLAPFKPEPSVSPEAMHPFLRERFGRIKRYTMENGLSNNDVWDIAQDEEGFLWFGTREGLNRFDGAVFTTFYHKTDGTGLPANQVTALLALPGARLLVGTTKGLVLLHTHNLTFEKIELPFRADSHEFDRYITALETDKSGRIFVGGNSGAFLLDSDCRLLDAFFFPPEATPLHLRSYRVQYFLPLPDGRMAFKGQMNNGPAPWQILDFENKRLEPLAFFAENFAKREKDAYTDVCRSGERFVWFSNFDANSQFSLFRFDFATGQSLAVMPPFYNIKIQNGGFYFPQMLPDSLLLLQRCFGQPLVLDLRTRRSYDLPFWESAAFDGKSAATFVDRAGNLWACPMPHMTGFELLERLGKINFDVIFTTAYDQYALQAFKVAASDYLLKPIDMDELERAVQKVKQKRQSDAPGFGAFEQLFRQIQRPEPRRLALPTAEGLIFLPFEEIVYLQSDSNYTIFFTTGKEKTLVSKTLKDFEEPLEHHHFFRAHNSYIINMLQITRYVRGEGGTAVTSNGMEIEISRQRKEDFIKKLEETAVR